MAEPGHYQMFISIRRAPGDVSKCGCSGPSPGLYLQYLLFPLLIKSQEGEGISHQEVLDWASPREELGNAGRGTWTGPQEDDVVPAHEPTAH